jgi:comEA protein
MGRRELHGRFFLLFVFCCFVFAAGSEATKKPPIKPININTATSDELQQVPGIGPVTAEKILQMRKSYGAFKSVDDLLSIRGIGKKRLEKMRKYLTVSKVPGAGKSPAATKSQPQSPASTANKPKPSMEPTETEEPPR